MWIVVSQDVLMTLISMGPEMSTLEDDGFDLQRFAAGLRGLLAAAGFPSIRALARKVNYSHTILANAVNGKRLPTWDVTRAFVTACDGDVDEWERTWRFLYAASKAPDHKVVIPSPPWPAQAVADGADPEDSLCYMDARTVAARKISLTTRRQIVGIVELRYCERQGATWGRFRGSEGLDRIAIHRHQVDATVEVVRDSDGLRMSFTPKEYPFDNQWCDLVVTDGGLFYACATVFFDGETVAYGQTDMVALT
jgi:hypothetical protein